MNPLQIKKLDVIYTGALTIYCSLVTITASGFKGSIETLTDAFFFQEDGSVLVSTKDYYTCDIDAGAVIPVDGNFIKIQNPIVKLHIQNGNCPKTLLRTLIDNNLKAEMEHIFKRDEDIGYYLKIEDGELRPNSAHDFSDVGYAEQTKGARLFISKTDYSGYNLTKSILTLITSTREEVVECLLEEIITGELALPESELKKHKSNKRKKN